MKKSTKITLAVLGTLTVAGGVFATSVLANEEQTLPTVFSRAAEILGVEEEEMDAAFDQAWQEQVDQLVEEGKITEDKAEKMKEHGYPFGRRFYKKKRHTRAHLVKTLSDELDMAPKELIEEWREAENLADVIKNQGKNVDEVKKVLIEEAETKIDEAVENGKIDEDKASTIKESLAEKVDKFLYEFPAPPQKPDIDKMQSPSSTWDKKDIEQNKKISLSSPELDNLPTPPIEMEVIHQ
jgi:ribosomal protein S20